MSNDFTNKELIEFLELVNGENWSYVSEDDGMVKNIFGDTWTLKEAVKQEIEGTLFCLFENFNDRDKEKIIDFIGDFDYIYHTNYLEKLKSDDEQNTPVGEGEMPF